MAASYSRRVSSRPTRPSSTGSTRPARRYCGAARACDALRSFSRRAISHRESSMPAASLLAVSLTLIEAVAYSKGLSPPVRLSPGRAAGALAPPDEGEGQGGRTQGRRALLHGSQQPESAQPAFPRFPETVGGLYGRENFLDRPRSGRLQPATATSDRDRHGRLRHP